MTSFHVGDIPAEPLVIEPDQLWENSTPLDLASVTLRDGAGDLVSSPGLTVTKAGIYLTINWPSVSLFESPGLYTLTPVLTKSDGPGRETLAPIQIVIQSESGWHNLDSARAQWADAPSDDASLFLLLEAAREACENYAPAITGAVPQRYKQAQLMQARNLSNASKADPNGGLGEEGFAIRVTPLDWFVKQILRPKKALGPIG